MNDVQGTQRQPSLGVRTISWPTSGPTVGPANIDVIRATFAIFLAFPLHKASNISGASIMEATPKILDRRRATRMVSTLGAKASMI